MRFSISFFLLFTILSPALAQKEVENSESLLITGEQIELKPTKKYYDPRIASTRSAIFPGWGQIYNDSWWKAPIIYAGFGLAIHFVGLNERNRNLNLESAAFELAQAVPNQNRIRVFRQRADGWRKNRDLVILGIIGGYALQIIEASVDAHLKGFDVDENLALNLKPKLGSISNGTPYVGFGFTLPIGR